MGRAATAESTDLGGIDNVERAMRRATTQEVTRLEKALTFLATTASTAPFVGLFGTVWGVMTAFRGLTTAQTSSIQAVAPGIAEALVATAVGLGGGDSGGRGVQSLRARDPRVDGRHGKLLRGVLEHRGAPLHLIEPVGGHGLRDAIAELLDLADQRRAAGRRDARAARDLHGDRADPPARRLVELPQAKAGALSGEEEQLVVTVDKKGVIYLNDNVIAIADLAAKLEAVTG